MDKELFKIGYSFLFGRKTYEIVAIFEDDGETFYVTKTLTNYGVNSYCNIFYFTDNGELHKHV